ncbi:LemA family protein [Boudabousia tangfeifanii]|uniref:LemA family protein n=1 Tax=Boudabousia tangfeifanii TaxID=1912795 RepID=A0A1D9MM82_9ACTO|nr:LemA family protein [Boudabousia tangfeifanii]AOZ73250.1 LemA family protein [Boudabousia tangfeifanii]
MSALAIIGIVFLVLVILLGVFLIVSYNSFVNSRELVKNAKSQIAVQMETRWDALTSLISATKKYSEHESKVLHDTVQQRTGVNKDSAVSELEKDESTFTSAFNRLLAVAENYPDLKASEVYKETMRQLGEYEENIRMARMVFNDTTTKYNRKVLVFPMSIVAAMFGFRELPYFQISEGKSSSPSWD